MFNGAVAQNEFSLQTFFCYKDTAETREEEYTISCSYKQFSCAAVHKNDNSPLVDHCMKKLKGLQYGRNALKKK